MASRAPGVPEAQSPGEVSGSRDASRPPALGLATNRSQRKHVCSTARETLTA